MHAREAAYGLWLLISSLVYQMLLGENSAAPKLWVVDQTKFFVVGVGVLGEKIEGHVLIYEGFCLKKQGVLNLRCCCHNG